MERRSRYIRNPRHVVVAHPSDVEYFLWLDEFHWLHTHHLVDLTGRNKQAVYRRLNQLYHAKYIDRVRNPENYYTGPGSEPCYLVLDNEGARVLAQPPWNTPFRDRRGAIRNLKTPPQHDETRRRRVYNLRHDMLIPTTLAAFMRAVRGTTMEILPKRILLEKLPLSPEQQTKPFDWIVPVVHERVLDVTGIHPDTVFAIHYTELPENRNRAFFFVECDTASEDVYNRDLGVKSIYRMMLAYSGTREQNLTERLFGMRTFRVLFLLPDEKRLHEIKRMIERQNIHQLPGFSPRMYLFNWHSSTLFGQDILNGWVDLNGEDVLLKR